MTKKAKRLALPNYLNAVRNHVNHCVKCGETNGLDIAHYSGLYSDKLGNGMGSKSHDYCVARLCRHCHQQMDSYELGNSEQRAWLFVGHIYFTMRELIGVKHNSVTIPKDLKRQQWLNEMATELMWLVCSDDSMAVTSKDLIDCLASKRNYIAKVGS